MKVRSPIDEAGDLITRDYADKRWLTVVKGSDEGRINNPSFSDDSALTVSVEASTTYLVKMGLFVKCTARNNIGYALTVPSGTTYRLGGGNVASGTEVSTALQGNAQSVDDTTTVGLIGATPASGGTPFPIYLAGYGAIFVSSTSGSVTLKWLAGANNTSVLTVMAKSWMKLLKV